MWTPYSDPKRGSSRQVIDKSEMAQALAASKPVGLANGLKLENGTISIGCGYSQSLCLVRHFTSRSGNIYALFVQNWSNQIRPKIIPKIFPIGI